MPQRRAAYLPNIQTGYAASQVQAEYPEFWDGLVAAWPFGLLSPRTSIQEGTRKQDPLTYVGAPTWEASQYGNVIKLNGTSDALQVSNMSQLSSTQTMTMIVRCTKSTALANYDTLISNRPAGIQSIIVSGASGNPLAFNWDNHNSQYNLASGLTITLNAWNFCALVKNGTSSLIYMNKASATTSRSTSSKDLSSISVGYDYNNNSPARRWWGGLIAEVYLYDYPLSTYYLDFLADAPYAPFVKRRRFFAPTGPVDIDYATNIVLASSFSNIDRIVNIDFTANAALSSSFSNVTANLFIDLSANALMQSSFSDIDGVLDCNFLTNSLMQSSFSNIDAIVDIDLSVNSLLQSSVSDITPIVNIDFITNSLLESSFSNANLGYSIDLSANSLLQSSVSDIDAVVDIDLSVSSLLQSSTSDVTPIINIDYAVNSLLQSSFSNADAVISIDLLVNSLLQSSVSDINSIINIDYVVNSVLQSSFSDIDIYLVGLINLVLNSVMASNFSGISAVVDIDLSSNVLIQSSFSDIGAIIDIDLLLSSLMVSDFSNITANLFIDYIASIVLPSNFSDIDAIYLVSLIANILLESQFSDAILFNFVPDLALSQLSIDGFTASVSTLPGDAETLELNVSATVSDISSTNIVIDKSPSYTIKILP